MRQLKQAFHNIRHATRHLFLTQLHLVGDLLGSVEVVGAGGGGGGDAAMTYG